MKKLLLVLVVVALLGGGYYAYAQNKQKEAAETNLELHTAIAERGDIRQVVSATGRVEPEREVEIKSKASGEVKEVTVDISDTVKQGQLLFRLDPTDEERSVKRLTASLTMSKAKLQQTKLKVSAAEAKLEADTTRANADLAFAKAEKEEFQTRLRRALELHEQRVISREELDTAQTKAVQVSSNLENANVKLEDLKVQSMELEQLKQEIPIAEAQVENDEISLADAEQRLIETEVFAPIDGVVSERGIQEGYIVSSGISNVGGGTTTMKIVDLSRVYAIAAVDEADIKGVQPGVKAIITADAFPGMNFNGVVVRVATTGVVESNVVTFDVKVEVEGRGKMLLKPEMTTNVQLLIDESVDVVTVPVEAVARRAALKNGDSDYSRRESYVTLRLPNGTTEDRVVKTGLNDGYTIEITSGLQEGEEVVYDRNLADSRWAGRGMPGLAGPGGRRPPPPR